MIKHQLNKKIHATRKLKNSYRAIMSKITNNLTNKPMEKINTKEISYFSSYQSFVKR